MIGYRGRAHKRDTNEKDLVKYLREQGVDVWHVSIGDFPDLICCDTATGTWFPVEIKKLTGKKKPRPKPLSYGQQVFFDLARQRNAPCYRISTTDEVDVMLLDLKTRHADRTPPGKERTIQKI